MIRLILEYIVDFILDCIVDILLCISDCIGFLFKRGKTESVIKTDEEYYNQYQELIGKYDTYGFAKEVISKGYKYENNPYVSQRICQIKRLIESQ